MTDCMELDQLTDLAHDKQVPVDFVLSQVACRSKLAEGSEGVRSVLRWMYRHEGINNKELSRGTGISVPTLAAVRGELTSLNVLESKTQLGESGVHWCQTRLGLKYSGDSFAEISETIENVTDVLKQRPSPDFALDQARATPETVKKRALYMMKHGLIEGQRIVLLGDDDATSLALGLTGLADSITVVDIDERVLLYLQDTARTLGVANLTTIQQDLRHAFSKDFQNSFDVVLTDPPYTQLGVRLFLKRARQLLKSSVGYKDTIAPVAGKGCVLCFGNKPPQVQQRIHISIMDHGFTIREIIPNFNQYLGASIIGQSSHLYNLCTTTGFLHESELSYKEGPLYIRDEKEWELPIRPIGFHFIAELPGIQQSVLLDNEAIKSYFLESLSSAGLSVVDVFHHIYHPYGYSIIAILESSHATVHTWPEHEYASVDLFVCSAPEMGEKAIKLFAERMQVESPKIQLLKRGSVQ